MFKGKSWIWNMVGAFALIAVLVIWGVKKTLVSGRVTGESPTAQQSEASPAVNPTPPASPEQLPSAQPPLASQPVAQASTPAATEPEKPVPTNCHDNPMAKVSLASGTSAQTRSDFASKVASTLPNDHISIYATGDDQEHLMFVTQEENEAEFMNVVAAVGRSFKARINLCEQGFVDEQFILKGVGGKQTLLLKVSSNAEEVVRYEMRNAASPM